MIRFRFNNFFSAIGYTLSMFGRAMLYTPRIPFRWGAIRREMWIIGVESLPLACFFLFLIGMVFSLQTGVGLAPFGQEVLVGRLVSMGMVSELGPWMTAFVLIARNGSSMAAEIGTMKISDEISALKIMSVNLEDYIVMPRIIAFVVMAPILTVIATAVGVLGGMLVATLQLAVPVYVYLDGAVEGLKPPLVLYWSVLKAVVFALTASIIACSFGLRTKGGALGVGKASRDTVVYSLFLVVLFNFMLTSLYQILIHIIEGE